MGKQNNAAYTPLFRDPQGNILMIGLGSFLFETPEEATACGEAQAFFRAIGVQYTGENQKIQKLNNGRFLTSLMKVPVVVFIVDGPEMEKARKQQREREG